MNGCNFLIAECSKEMSELNRVQRGDVLNFKFNENLEKAKADLAAVGRQWSALKKRPWFECTVPATWI